MSDSQSFRPAVAHQSVTVVTLHKMIEHASFLPTWRIEEMIMRKIGFAGAAVALILAAGCGEPAPGTNGAGTPPADPELPSTAVPASATWTLDGAASRIGFSSIKAGEIIETHIFPGLTGSVAPDGSATIEIALDTVDTKIDIRNERMREMLFETGTYPTATIAATVDTSAYADLAVGARTEAEIDATLDLHGVKASVFADAFVTRISDTRVEVSSAEPVVVYVDEFNLTDGIEALRSVAGLPSITPASPVTFTLIFEAG